MCSFKFKNKCFWMTSFQVIYKEGLAYTPTSTTGASSPVPDMFLQKVVQETGIEPVRPSRATGF